MFLPPASLITMSGRSAPSDVETPTCSSKSHLLAIPASSTTRRSCISPQRPACFRPPQGCHQRLGLGAQLIRALPGDRDLLGERCMRGPAGRLALAQLALHPGQGVAQRLDQLLDRCLPGVKVARRLGVGGAEPALGHRQEGLGAAIEGLRGQCLEPVRELAVDQGLPLLGGSFHQGSSLVRGPRPLLGGPGLTGQVGGEPGQPSARQQVADDGTESGTQQEADEQRNRVHILHACSRWRQFQGPTRPAGIGSFVRRGPDQPRSAATGARPGGRLGAFPLALRICR